jgi:hypothetical protein
MCKFLDPSYNCKQHPPIETDLISLSKRWTSDFALVCVPLLWKEELYAREICLSGDPSLLLKTGIVSLGGFWMQWHSPGSTSVRYTFDHEISGYIIMRTGSNCWLLD